MSPNDNAGRISRHAFLVSTLTLLVVCLISASARFYVRIRVQKQVSIDDGFLLFGLCCLISAVGILFTFMDSMYMVEALIFGVPDLELPPDWIQRAFDYQKMAAVSLILTWCSIVSVKFSFLFLFRRLIDRVRNLVIYWWVVLVFNIAISGYGAAVYIIACPHFYSMQALECGQGSGTWRAINYSISQMILDILGDLLILYIPVRLIWQIRVRWSQKAALAVSLCLTIVIIVVTIVRVSGLHQGNKLDSVWETFWQMMSAEVGLIMTALTAFRVLFVARNNERGQQRPGAGRQRSSKSKQLLRRLLTPSSWRKGGSSQTSGGSGGQDCRGNKMEKNFPSIPRGTMTGIRTFIDGQGRTRMGESQMMQSTVSEETDDISPMSAKIQVQHELSSKSERVSDDTSNPRRGREYV